MTRVNAREILMQIFFQMETQRDFSNESKNRYIELNVEEKDQKQLSYIHSVSNAYFDHSKEIDNLIEKYSNGWKLSRLSKVDLAAMRICIAESYYVEEELKTPVGVAINEAVRIVKKYDTDSSGKFVNGILGEIARNDAN